MSITIPTYAISVTYLARETSRTIQDLGKRRRELAEKLDELRKKLEDEAGVKAIEQEMAKYKEEDERLKDRQLCLSAKGAVGYPFAGFFVALAVVAYGYYTGGNELSPAALFLSMGYGVYRLSKSLAAIERAAMRPEKVLLPDLKARFSSGASSMSFKVSQQQAVEFMITNEGEDVEEAVMVTFNFSPEFGVKPGTDYDVVKQGPTTAHPGWNSTFFKIDIIHVDLSIDVEVNLKLPDKPGSYVVPVVIRAKKVGKLESELRFEVMN